MIRVAVTGGRDFADFKLVERALNFLHMEEGISAVIHGDYRGADHLCRDWALQAGVEPVPFPADWKRHGPPAGPIRNRTMLIEGKPDLLVWFPGGKGTADCIEAAEERGIRVMSAVEYVAACMSVSSHQPASGGAQCKAHPRPPS